MSKTTKYLTIHTTCRLCGLDELTVNKDGEDFPIMVDGKFMHVHKKDCEYIPLRVVETHACPDGRLFVWGTMAEL